jgi:hypothetical protein
MEPNWRLTARRFEATATRAAALPNSKTLAMRRTILATPDPAAAANLYFPDEGLFGCEVAFGWVLRPSLQDTPGPAKQAGA